MLDAVIPLIYGKKLKFKNVLFYIEIFHPTYFLSYYAHASHLFKEPNILPDKIVLKNFLVSKHFNLSIQIGSFFRVVFTLKILFGPLLDQNESDQNRSGLESFHLCLHIIFVCLPIYFFWKGYFAPGFISTQFWVFHDIP